MKRRYLIVDDNSQFAENVAEILQETGADVCVASGAGAAEKALNAIRTERFDGVVTDMRMPGTSGADLLGVIRTIDPSVPVVLVSAYSEEEQLLRARRHGLLAFLSKPASMERLLDLLQRARRDATILLVEDDRGLAENMTEVLSNQGYTVCAVSTLHELDQVDVRPFAALVDLRLPGANDGESLTRVRRKFSDVPMIVLTGLSALPDLGDAELIQKPFDLRAVLQRIESLAANRS